MKLGVPTMIGMLISSLYNAIDAYFVGGLGMSQMGAASVVFPIVHIVIGLGMMFGAGASSYISRSLGKGDNAEANRAASTALFASVLVGAVIITGIKVFLDPVLASLRATDTILPYARTYAQIYVTGSIINVFTVTMNNLLTAALIVGTAKSGCLEAPEKPAAISVREHEIRHPPCMRQGQRGEKARRYPRSIGSK